MVSGFVTPGGKLGVKVTTKDYGKGKGGKKSGKKGK